MGGKEKKSLSSPLTSSRKTAINYNTLHHMTVSLGETTTKGMIQELVRVNLVTM